MVVRSMIVAKRSIIGFEATRFALIWANHNVAMRLHPVRVAVRLIAGVYMVLTIHVPHAHAGPILLRYLETFPEPLLALLE